MIYRNITFQRCVLLTTMIIFILCFAVSALSAQQNKTLKKELVILLHGLGRGKSIMAPMGERLEKAGFDVSIVDYSSIGKSPEEILTVVACPENAKVGIHLWMQQR